jgi:hypothetical protein
MATALARQGPPLSVVVRAAKGPDRVIGIAASDPAGPGSDR